MLSAFYWGVGLLVALAPAGATQIAGGQTSPAPEPGPRSTSSSPALPLKSPPALPTPSEKPSPEAAPRDANLQRFEFTQIQMGMPFKLVFYVADETTANLAAKAVFARIEALNRVMSDYDLDSELSRLSAGAPHDKPVPVSDDLWRVLAASQTLAQQTDGAFDITAGPVIKLWRRARRRKELPRAENLVNTLAATGFRHLRIDPQARSVQLLKPNMQLDLGGIAAGYACDEGLKVLARMGIRRALVDSSGDVLVGDPPPGQDAWRIGLVEPTLPAPGSPNADPEGKPPVKSSGAVQRYLLLANAAVTTSGDVEQFVELGGVRYSHIVDPHTGMGLTDRSVVVVVAKDCVTADSHATALSVLGPEAGLKLIEATPEAAAIIYRKQEGKLESFQSARVKQLHFEPVQAAKADARR